MMDHLWRLAKIISTMNIVIQDVESLFAQQYMELDNNHFVIKKYNVNCHLIKSQ